MPNRKHREGDDVGGIPRHVKKAVEAAERERAAKEKAAKEKRKQK